MLDRGRNVNSGWKARAVTTVAGVALLIPASIGLFSSDSTVLGALPALTVLPAFVFSYIAVATPMVAFFLWHRGLFRGESGIPRRTYILVGAAVVLSIAYFAGGWGDGLKYQGFEHTRDVCLVNAAWAVFLTLAFARAWKRGASFSASLLLHWMLFAWLGWYAFPYLGELP